MVDAIAFGQVAPILRILDIAKADEFYLGFLDFAVDWDHRFDQNAPLYRQVSRQGLCLHLSEHHGDGTPGVRIAIRGIVEFQRELTAKANRYMRPGLDRTPWNTIETGVFHVRQSPKLLGARPGVPVKRRSPSPLQRGRAIMRSMAEGSRPLRTSSGKSGPP